MPTNKLPTIKKPKKKKRPGPGQPRKKHPGGRPTVMTPEVLAKLEMAWSIGCSTMEAVAFAGISYDAVNDYIKKYPEYSETIEKLKQKPFLKARQTVIQNLGDVNTSKWYLEKKLRNEFGNVQIVEQKTDLKIEKEVDLSKFSDEQLEQLRDILKTQND